MLTVLIFSKHSRHPSRIPLGPRDKCLKIVDFVIRLTIFVLRITIILLWRTDISDGAPIWICNVKQVTQTFRKRNNWS